MTDIHRALAIATLAIAIAGLAWSVLMAVRRQPAGRLYIVLAGFAMGCSLATGALGALLLGTSRKPDDALHLVYGLVSLVTLPIAAVFAVGRSARGQAVVMALGWFVELGVVVRLFQTG